IDVAYKYFTTRKRKFIIADTPGHAEYTGNMFTGASTANLAIILIDVRHGITEQTRRHTYIADLLGIPGVVVCVNKMDLVDFSQQRFNEVVESFKNFSANLRVKEMTFIPLSAISGDNVVHSSKNMPWYHGKSLLEHLEEVEIETGTNFELPRFMVQYVIRKNTTEFPGFIGYAGKISSGTFKKGDKIIVFPSKTESEISCIKIHNKEVDKASAQQSVIIQLKESIEVNRGNTLASKNNLPAFLSQMQATICWMSGKPLSAGAKLILQHYSNKVKVEVEEVKHKINLNNLQFESIVENDVELNDIVTVNLRTEQPIAFDRYRLNRNYGGFILIDEITGNTVAAGFF
ncbi:MAG TPA: GTP-binding protein, partial [Bacteroidia bacterium]|nr:GTP-binding protein [Bacteroidia bacterium]